MRGSALAFAIGWLAGFPGPVASQELDGPRVIPPVPVAPAAYLAEGRDPFVPLIGTSEDEGRPPRLDQLVLTGIFQGAPGNSLVVLEDPARRGHFLRAGESLGHARLLAILPDAAVFEVEDYGSVRQDTLRLEPDRADPTASAPAIAPAGEPEPAARPSEEGS